MFDRSPETEYTEVFQEIFTSSEAVKNYEDALVTALLPAMKHRDYCAYPAASMILGTLISLAPMLAEIGQKEFSDTASNVVFAGVGISFITITGWLYCGLQGIQSPWTYNTRNLTTFSSCRNQIQDLTPENIAAINTCLSNYRKNVQISNEDKSTFAPALRAIREIRAALEEDLKASNAVQLNARI